VITDHLFCAELTPHRKTNFWKMRWCFDISDQWKTKKDRNRMTPVAKGARRISAETQN
jgi:hypothetical protein